MLLQNPHDCVRSVWKNIQNVVTFYGVLVFFVAPFCPKCFKWFNKRKRVEESNYLKFSLMIIHFSLFSRFLPSHSIRPSLEHIHTNDVWTEGWRLERILWNELTRSMKNGKEYKKWRRHIPLLSKFNIIKVDDDFVHIRRVCVCVCLFVNKCRTETLKQFLLLNMIWRWTRRFYVALWPNRSFLSFSFTICYGCTLSSYLPAS